MMTMNPTVYAYLYEPCSGTFLLFEITNYPAPQNEPFHTLLISESIEKQKRYFTNRRK